MPDQLGQITVETELLRLERELEQTKEALRASEARQAAVLEASRRRYHHQSMGPDHRVQPGRGAIACAQALPASTSTWSNRSSRTD